MEIKLNIKARFFNEAYLPYLYFNPKGKSRIMAFYGGAGSGKSVFVVQNTILKALASKRRVLVVRKVGNTIRDSIFKEYKQALSQFGLLDKCSVKESYLTITLPNGSEFLFKGMEDDDKIRSISGITDIVCEEASDLSLAEFSQLQLRLRDLKSGNNQIFLMYNPVSKARWVYPYFHSTNPKAVAGRPKDLTLVQTTYKDNKFLPQSYIDELNTMMHNNPVYYQVFALGQFATLGRPVFSNWRIESVDAQKLRQEGLQAYVGLDFGFTNDPTTVVACMVDPVNKKLHIFLERYQLGMLNHQIASMLKGLGLQRHTIKADSSEPKSIAELRRLGITGVRGARKGKDSIMHGIQALQAYDIIVDPSCEKMILEFENYTWKENKHSSSEEDKYLNVPIAEFNHLIDALRYACEDFVPRNKIRSMTKASFGL